MMEANVRYSINADPSHLIASPSADSQIFKAASDLTTNYTFATPTRVVELTTGPPNPLTDDQAVRILTSVP